MWCGGDPFDRVLVLFLLQSSIRSVLRWKHRLYAVHLSDRIGPFVDHVLPGEGFNDFCEVFIGRMAKTNTKAVGNKSL